MVHGWTTAARIDTGIVAAYALLFAALLLIHPLSHSQLVTADDVGQFVGPLLIVALFAFRVLEHRRSDRSEMRPQGMTALAPLLIVLGPLCFAVGQMIWTYYETVIHQPPFPSWADAGFLAAYPFLMLGILFLPKRPLSPVYRTRVLLDSVIALSAVVTFSWYFVLGPTVAQSGESLFARLVGTAYPFFDLILVWCLLVLAGRSRFQLETILLSAGLLVIVVTDSLFDYGNLHNTYATGSVQDAGWPLGYMLLGLGAIVARRAVTLPLESQEKAPIDPSSGSLAGKPAGWTSLIPYLLVPAAIALMMYVARARGDQNVDLGVFIGVSALMLCVFLRQLFVILENRNLTHNLQHQLSFTSALTQHLADGLLGLDTAGRVIYANPSAGQMLGRPGAQLLGKYLQDLVYFEHDNFAAASAPHWSDASSDRSATFVRQDGTPFEASVSLSRVVIDGRVEGMVANFRPLDVHQALQERYAIGVARESLLLSGQSAEETG